MRPYPSPFAPSLAFAIVLSLASSTVEAQQSSRRTAPAERAQVSGGGVGALVLAPPDIWVDENGDTMTGTLTLAPEGDRALDLASGSLYKSGALFLHSRGGVDNTALGSGALSSTTSGYGNVAIGSSAQQYDATGNENVSVGARALRNNTTASRNTAIGTEALAAVDTGYFSFGSTAIGHRALTSTTYSGLSTAVGTYALESFAPLAASSIFTRATAVGHGAMRSLSGGYGNVAVGVYALANLTSGSFNIAIGDYSGVTGAGYGNIAIGAYAGGVSESQTTRIGAYQTRAFIAGIRGVTTDHANGLPVLIDSAGQLGTVSSSLRFKEDIEDMGEATKKLLDLRPVTFRFRPEVQEGERPLEYGLIAEEVAELFPDLVVHDEQGRPTAVKYHLLSSMLLNELKSATEQLASHEERLARLEARLVSGEARPTGVR